MSILEKMLEKSKQSGVVPTENIEKIARAKNMMFGEENWQKCPCDSQNENRYCISELCLSDIMTNGKCHCNCYKKED